MARQLKTFQTSIGFYDLAVAAPSMKAALAAWGAGSNLFHQGLAKESDDPAVVAATRAKPGVVLKRPVGSTGRFAEQAALPEVPTDSRAKPKRKAAPKKAAPKSAKADKRREAARQREEAARAKEVERREKAIAKAQAALDRARDDHEARAGAIATERAAVDKRFEDQEARWETQESKLQAALRKARQ